MCSFPWLSMLFRCNSRILPGKARFVLIRSVTSSIFQMPQCSFFFAPSVDPFDSVAVVAPPFNPFALFNPFAPFNPFNFVRRKKSQKRTRREPSKRPKRRNVCTSTHPTPNTQRPTVNSQHSTVIDDQQSTVNTQYQSCSASYLNGLVHIQCEGKVA